MIHLPESLAAWNSPRFQEVLKQELEQLGPRALPLQQGLSASSYAVDEQFQVMVISATESADTLRARVGIFFTGILSGCNCAGDPTPVEPQNEYCELMIAIDKSTAQAAISLTNE